MSLQISHDSAMVRIKICRCTGLRLVVGCAAGTPKPKLRRTLYRTPAGAERCVVAGEITRRDVECRTAGGLVEIDRSQCGVIEILP